MTTLSRRLLLEILGGAATMSVLGVSGSGLSSSAVRAASSSPSPGLFLTARTRAGGGHGGALLSGDGDIVTEFELPGRGHGAAVRPGGAEAVVFARRPGTFALVLDPRSGTPGRLVAAEPGRHFYGHGCYSADGAILYATENDFEGERGVIGLYDARDGYRRLGEFPSHGIGPHQTLLMPDGGTLLVANGGILTHPDVPRMKLNLSEMKPSVALVDANDGSLIARFEPPKELHQLSLRHLDVRDDGRIAVGGQWQGAPLEQPPLVAVIDRDGGLRFGSAPASVMARMRNYCGSVTFAGDGGSFAVSAPRGGLVTLWNGNGGFRGSIELEDGCGLAANGDGFLITSGRGAVATAGSQAVPLRLYRDIAFDNHLVVVGL